MISYIFKRMIIFCQLQNLCNRQIRVQINLIMRQHKYHIKCQSETLSFFLFFSFIKKKKTFVGVQLLYDVVLVSTVQQSKSAICIHILPAPHFFGFSSHLGHHRALRRVLCATQSVLFSYLFYTQQCIYVSLPIHPTHFVILI